MFSCDTKPAFFGDVFGCVVLRRILSKKINDLNTDLNTDFNAV